MTSLIFTGGGTRGIVYSGVLRALEEYFSDDPQTKNPLKNYLEIKQLIGVSIGAFVAFCITLGITAHEMYSYAVQTPFSLDLDPSELQIFSRDSLEKMVMWAFDLKKIPYDTTFTRLYNLTKIDLCMSATCVSPKLEYTVFNHNLTPTVKIKDALIASMNLPVCFEPYSIDEKLYVDGGMYDNLPVELVTYPFIGFDISKKPVYPPKNLFDVCHNCMCLIQLRPPSKQILDLDPPIGNLETPDIELIKKVFLYGFDRTKKNIKKLINSTKV